MKPFVAIMSTMRTGSTLLQEMLTSLPQSFIFHEPLWGRGIFQNPHLAIDALQPYGIDIEQLLDVEAQGNLHIFLQKLSEYIIQLGVKEIRLAGWETYAASVIDPRFILTVRDPRDVYISCWKLQQRESNCGPRVRPMTPQSLFDELKPDYDRQMEIDASRHDSMWIKYEDLCRDPQETFEQVATFVDSPLSEIGKVGAFHKMLQRGRYESDLHGNNITSKSVSIINSMNPIAYSKIIGEAVEFAVLTQTYWEKWGYK